jgi:hypothetical protein
VNAPLREHLAEAADQAVDLAAELTGPHAMDATVPAAVHLTYLAGLVRGVLDQLEDVGRVEVQGEFRSGTSGERFSGPLRMDPDVVAAFYGLPPGSLKPLDTRDTP